MTTGSTIRSARVRAGLSQRRAAIKLGVSNTSVARWENDDVPPTARHAAALERLLGLPSGSLSTKKKTAAAR